MWEKPEQWTGNRRFIFLLPSSHASRKMLCLPCLADKVPVMQAITAQTIFFRRMMGTSMPFSVLFADEGDSKSGKL